MTYITENSTSKKKLNKTDLVKYCKQEHIKKISKKLKLNCSKFMQTKKKKTNLNQNTFRSIK